MLTCSVFWKSDKAIAVTSTLLLIHLFNLFVYFLDGSGLQWPSSWMPPVWGELFFRVNFLGPYCHSMLGAANCTTTCPPCACWGWCLFSRHSLFLWGNLLPKWPCFATLAWWFLSPPSHSYCLGVCLQAGPFFFLRYLACTSNSFNSSLMPSC